MTRKRETSCPGRRDSSGFVGDTPFWSGQKLLLLSSPSSPPNFRKIQMWVPASWLNLFSAFHKDSGAAVSVHCETASHNFYLNSFNLQNLLGMRALMLGAAGFQMLVVSASTCIWQPKQLQWILLGFFLLLFQ